MTGRNLSPTGRDKASLWSELSAPLPAGVISWRQDGKPTQRDGKHFARFVAYIEANTVRERLDAIVPGEWDLTLELMPALPGVDDETAAASFKARLQILGVIREDVGTGKDYKQASTDAFKRAAVRFGIAHELYAYEANWVQVDGDGKYAKPLEDPQTAYVRRWGAPGATPSKEERDKANAARQTQPAAPAAEYGSENVLVAHPDGQAGTVAAHANTPAGPAHPDSKEAAKTAEEASAAAPACPKCSGRMWDNRASKRNPKAPDYKCRDRSCDGVVWPDAKPAAPGAPKAPPAPARDLPPDTDDIPF
jgi:hypothetical protein